MPDFKGFWTAITDNPVSRFIKHRPATSFMLTAGVVKTFTQNYWIFDGTNTLGSDDEHENAQEFFYMLGELFSNESLFGCVGYIADNVIECRQALLNKMETLIQSNQFTRMSITHESSGPGPGAPGIG